MTIMIFLNSSISLAGNKINICFIIRHIFFIDECSGELGGHLDINLSLSLYLCSNVDIYLSLKEALIIFFDSLDE